MTALETMRTFGLDSLPNLDTAVLGSLEFFSQTPILALNFDEYRKPMVVGSVNAAAVGRLLFAGREAVFADESTYKAVMALHSDIDAVIVISASGSKHAVEIVHGALSAGVPVYLITNNANAPAGKLLDTEQVYVLPKTREPYTYNVSTYLGMLLAISKENPPDILQFIIEKVASAMPDTLGTYDAFFLMIPPQFEDMKRMFRTKFDELFGPKLMVRVFTFEEAKHAKAVVPSATECFISFGAENTLFGKPEQRLHIPLPENAGFATMMAVGYYVIGRIQSAYPPYFKEHIVQYTQKASEIFNETITPVVE